MILYDLKHYYKEKLKLTGALTNRNVKLADIITYTEIKTNVLSHREVKLADTMTDTEIKTDRCTDSQRSEIGRHNDR